MRYAEKSVAKNCRLVKFSLYKMFRKIDDRPSDRCVLVRF